jgi:hypothetical protein
MASSFDQNCPTENRLKLQWRLKQAEHLDFQFDIQGIQGCSFQWLDGLK